MPTWLFVISGNTKLFVAGIVDPEKFNFFLFLFYLALLKTVLKHLHWKLFVVHLVMLVSWILCVHENEENLT